MKKRIISGIAAVVLTFSGAGTALTNITDLTFDIAARAEETTQNVSTPDENPEEELPKSGTCGENLTWAVDEEGTLTISGTGDMYDYTKEDSPTWRYLDIKKAVIEDGVTRIGSYAFGRCYEVESITIPDSVTSIGFTAFARCNSLKTLTIPDSVTELDTDIFNCNEGIESVTLPNNITSIPEGTFGYCTNLKSVTIPDSVTSIGKGGFMGCSSLESITIPDSVTTIDQLAFLMCTSIETVTIPENVTSIGGMAFGYDYNFDNSEFSKLENFKLCCYKDSEGENYAKENGFEYELIGIAPNVPILKAVPGNRCVTLNWNAIENAEKYTVAVEVDGKWTIAAKTNETSYVLNGLKDGSEYKVAIIVMFNGEWNKDFSGAITVSPVATSGTCGENLTWTLNKNGMLTISGTGDMDDYTVDGDTPWSVAEVKNVVIGDGVTSIGKCAFFGCENLESVTIPDGVTSIGYGAFDACTSLKSAELGNGVTEIGEFAFDGCESLISINIPDGVTKLGENAFQNCSSLESIVVPGGVAEIGEHIFFNCSSLKNLTISDGVKSIGKLAFYGCIGLESVTIPDSVTSIGYGAFAICTNLKSAELGNSVTIIDESAFQNCSRLESINIPESVTSIGNKAFLNCSTLESITIPDGVESIGEATFCDCSSLKTVNLPKSVTSIGEYAFDECKSLTSIIIPESVTSIGNYAFCECKNLTSVIISDKVESIGFAAFAGCSSLESVIIPDSVTSIGEWSFYLCEKLKSINIPDGVTSIGNGTFYNCFALESIALPDSVTSIDEAAFNYCTNLGSLDLGNGVTSIGKNVFYGCGSLESLTLPESLTTIGYGAFYLCTGIKNVTIPESVTSIDEFSLGYYDEGNHEPGYEVKVENFKIRCFKDSAGEQYAKDNGFDYELVGETPVVNPVPTATPGDGCVTLNWEAIDNAEKYAVAVEVYGKWTIVKKNAGTSYVLNGLKSGTEYKVAVIAMFDGKWNKDFSNAIVVAPNEAVSKYPKVTNIEYSEKYNRVRLTWSAVEGAEEYGVAVKLGGKWKVVHTCTDETSFTSPKLKKGSTVEMVICAKINGNWETKNLNSRAFEVTVK